TSPAVAGFRAATQAARVAPMERPTTTSEAVRPASSRYAASAAAAQSGKPVVSRSSTDVPWPGRSGSSTAKPAATSASATPRIDDGSPVKPWSTRAPCGPPGAENGSAEGRSSGIGVLRAAGQGPPGLGGGRPVRVGHDAVDGAGGQALVAPAA